MAQQFGNMMRGHFDLAAGLNYEDVMPYMLRMSSIGVLAVVGREGSGRYNWIKYVADMLELMYPGRSKVYISDGIGKKLASMKEKRNVVRYSMIAEDIGLSVVNITIQDAFPPTEEVLSAFKNVENGNKNEMNKLVKEIVKAFDTLEINDEVKPKVGIVGEILVKYHPTANNNIVDVLEKEGAEVVVPELLDFFLYCCYNSKFKNRYLSGSSIVKTGCDIAISYIESYRKVVIKELQNSERFGYPSSINNLAKKAANVVSLGNQTGEGWLLTGEMVELIESDVNNIVCIQPFACLPNHITGKGMIKALKSKYPLANIVCSRL